MRILVSGMNDLSIHTVCEYSEQTEIAELAFSYNGPRFDMTSTEDDLGLSILKGLTEKISYEWLESSDYPNLLKLTIGR